MTETEMRFLRFVEPYRAFGDKIRMKIDHSLRVRALCMDIAGSAGFDAEEVDLAAVCGLVHDIGRFEQWRVYGTYNDSRSADHGDMGAEFLREGDRIRFFSEVDHETILCAVRYHNKYRVPEMLNEGDRRFVLLVRDADKLDILYSLAAGELNVRSRNTAMSEPVFCAMLEGRGIRKEELGTKADEIAIRLAFVFGLYFKRSFELLKEQDYIGGIIRRFIDETENELLREQLDVLNARIREYLEEKTHA